MSKPTSRARRAAKPNRVSPLISMYVPGLQPGAAALPDSVGRQPLIRKTVFGVTITRYRDGCELVYEDGRTLSAHGPWDLLMKLLRGGAKR